MALTGAHRQEAWTTASGDASRVTFAEEERCRRIASRAWSNEKWAYPGWRYGDALPRISVSRTRLTLHCPFRTTLNTGQLERLPWHTLGPMPRRIAQTAGIFLVHRTQNQAKKVEAGLNFLGRVAVSVSAHVNQRIHAILRPTRPPHRAMVGQAHRTCLPLLISRALQPKTKNSSASRLGLGVALKAEPVP